MLYIGWMVILCGHGIKKIKIGMLVTFVIGADEWQCRKNPIVTIIIGTKRFNKVLHCK